MTALSEEAPVDEFARTVARRVRPSRSSARDGVAGTSASIESSTPRSRARARSDPRPPHPADVAQARLFEELLRDDIDELENRAATAERRWYRRCDRTPDGTVAVPHELRQLRQLVREAHRLLDAMHRRFPPH